MLAAHEAMLDIIRDCTPNTAHWSAIVRDVMGGSVEADFELDEDEIASEIRQPVIEFLDTAVRAEALGQCPSLKTHGCRDLSPTCIPAIHAKRHLLKQMRPKSFTTVERCFLSDRPNASGRL